MSTKSGQKALREWKVQQDGVSHILLQRDQKVEGYRQFMTAWYQVGYIIKDWENAWRAYVGEEFLGQADDFGPARRLVEAHVQAPLEQRLQEVKQKKWQQRYGTR